jgi:hypothetical protein
MLGSTINKILFPIRCHKPRFIVEGAKTMKPNDPEMLKKLKFNLKNIYFMQHLLILLCSKYARPVMGHDLYTIIICSSVRSIRDVARLGTSRNKSTRVSACTVSFI